MIVKTEKLYFIFLRNKLSSVISHKVVTLYYSSFPSLSLLFPPWCCTDYTWNNYSELPLLTSLPLQSRVFHNFMFGSVNERTTLQHTAIKITAPDCWGGAEGVPQYFHPAPNGSIPPDIPT